MNSCMSNARFQSAKQCAPVLAGIKPSNLLILKETQSLEIMEVMDGTGLSFEYLYRGNGKSVWLVYWLEEMEKLLEQPETRLFLRSLGYRKFGLAEVFRFLKSRYTAYMSGGESYPHELGLLLGYPLEDVWGFMVNQGKNYLYSGYWKVYKNAENAKKTFALYRTVRIEAERLALEGKGLWEMIRALGTGRNTLPAV